jgi:hypothetical protein
VSCGADGTQSTQAVTFSSYAANDTLKLCGAFTSILTVQQSGVQILFENNAYFQIPLCGGTSGCIELNGKNNGLIDGGLPAGPSTSVPATFGDYGLGYASLGHGYIIQTTVGTLAATITNITCTGGVATVTGPSPFGYSLPNEPQVTITSNSVSSYNGTWTVASNTDGSDQFTFSTTCNGTGTGGSVGVLCPSGSYCASQVGTNIIDGQQHGGTGWEIRNIALGPYYQRTSYQDSGTTSSEFETIWINGCTSGAVSIHDLTAANAGIEYNPVNNDTCLTVYNAELMGGGDEITVSGSSSGQNVSSLSVHDVVFTDLGIGDTVGCSGHTDGIHDWSLSGSSATNEYFYNNWFTGNSGGCLSAELYLEGNHQTDYIFNNVFNPTYTQANNGVLNFNGAGPFLVANNTVIGQHDSDSCVDFQGNNYSTTGGLLSFENNVVANCSTLLVYKDSPTLTVNDYNAYSVGGYNYNGTGYNWSTGSPTWPTECSCDAHSQWFTANSSLLLNTNGSPQASSPVIGAATNLTSLSITALDSDTSLGNTRTQLPRPSTGNWAEGAFQYSSLSGVGTPAGMFAELFGGGR